MRTLLNPDTDHDPAATLRAERKARIAKNTAQQNANLSKAAATSSSTPQAAAADKRSRRETRKTDIDRTLLVSKTATASMGKFDNKIEGEPKVKGIKRKFEPLVGESYGEEKNKAMDVLKRVESGERKKVKGTEREEGAMNKRKAVRHLGKEQRAKTGRAKR